jgi:REP element-mobilizing transposase RayT
MPDYRWYHIPNSIVFITQVTKDRIRYLESIENLGMFWVSLPRVQEIYSFILLAYVILPDYLHFLMRMDDERGDFANIMHSIKRNFTINFKSFYA